MTEEQAKKLKNDKKRKESPELKEELAEDELKGLSGGGGPNYIPVGDGIYLDKDLLLWEMKA